MEYPHYEQPEKVEKILRGKANRAAGTLFEQLIDQSCIWYAEHGIAVIEKTPEPMRPISKPNRAGQFTACYTKQAQPDYKGTLHGGKSIVMEAKHTDSDRITFDRLSQEQRRELAAYDAMGAVAIILVSFGMQWFYCVPWHVWRDMKIRYGRKYLKPDDLSLFRIVYTGGRLDFLQGIGKYAIK